MPNEETFDPEKGMAVGDWVQRLIETVEIQAVLIEELHQRVNALAKAIPGEKALPGTAKKTAEQTPSSKQA